MVTILAHNGAISVQVTVRNPVSGMMIGLQESSNVIGFQRVTRSFYTLNNKLHNNISPTGYIFLDIT